MAGAGSRAADPDAREPRQVVIMRRPLVDHDFTEIACSKGDAAIRDLWRTCDAEQPRVTEVRVELDADLPVLLRKCISSVVEEVVHRVSPVFGYLRASRHCEHRMDRI